MIATFSHLAIWQVRAKVSALMLFHSLVRKTKELNHEGLLRYALGINALKADRVIQVPNPPLRSKGGCSLQDLHIVSGPLSEGNVPLLALFLSILFSIAFEERYI